MGNKRTDFGLALHFAQAMNDQRDSLELNVSYENTGKSKSDGVTTDLGDGFAGLVQYFWHIGDKVIVAPGVGFGMSGQGKIGETVSIEKAKLYTFGSEVFYSINKKSYLELAVRYFSVMDMNIVDSSDGSTISYDSIPAFNFGLGYKVVF